MMTMRILRLPLWTFAIFGCCFPVKYCKAGGPHYTTISTTLQDNQIFPSNDVEKADGHWSWSKPDTTSSVVSDLRKASPSFISGNYIASGNNLNRIQGATVQRADYFPYQYEFDTAGEDPHQLSPTSQGTDNALGSITKHFTTVSFIGLLLLFAIVQNSISTHQRKDATSSRKRRDLVIPNGLDFTTSEQDEILSNDAKIRCMQRTLCLENRKLRKRLGKTGKLLANYLTRTVKNSFNGFNGFPGWIRLLENAGQSGIRGEDCRILYRDCGPFENRRQRIDY